MAQGRYTREQLQTVPNFNYLSDPAYIAALKVFLDAERYLKGLQDQRYSADKINDDSRERLDWFINTYTQMFGNYVQTRKALMNTIEQGYKQDKSTTYTNSIDALNEQLRRQDVVAKFGLMTDDELTEYTTTAIDNLLDLPLYDQKAFLDELQKRGIEFNVLKLRNARDNQYKDDPNWNRAYLEWSGIQYSKPQGDNTMFAYLEPCDDGSYNTEYLTAKSLLTFGSSNVLVDDKINQLATGIDAMESIGKQRRDDSAAAFAKQTLDEADAKAATANSLKIADNDPRIDENSTKYKWDQFYAFLNERFGDEPRITANPVYSDAYDPKFDLDQRFNAMKSIYVGKKMLGTYKPLKVIDTKGKAPEEMSDEQINKLFGAPQYETE